MTNRKNERKKHIRKVAAFALSVILAFTANPVYIINATEIIPDISVSEDAVSNDTVSQEMLSLNGVSEDTVSDDAVSEDDIPVDIISENLISDAVISENNALVDITQEDIPFGAFDDDIIVENPEPLDEFKTPAGEGEESLPAPERGSLIMSVTAEEKASSAYAISYNGALEGFLPDSTRNQGKSSLCWAFSASLLAEMSMIKKGLAPQSVHYSEDQIGYYFFHHVVDPLGGTAGDENLIKGGSYYNYFNRAGNNAYNGWSLASWASVRDHAELPFIDSPYSDLPDDLAYNSKAHLQNIYWAQTQSSGSDVSYIENVKELIYEYGAASIIINGSVININENHAQYSPAAGGGHNVSLIGWDDNFVSANFTTKPPGDGAWYVRDNYGTRANRDENGCFWLSYYDAGIRRSTSKAIAFEFEDGDNYDHNYQYDGACYNSILGFNNVKNFSVANVFTAKDDEELKAVGFAPYVPETDYTVSIFLLDGKEAEPESGTEVEDARTSGSVRYAGYHTVPLTKSVSLNAGQTYSVVVSANVSEGYAGFFADESSDANDWVTFVASTSANQSYLKYGSTWYDLHGLNDGKNDRYRTARIKAYTDDAQYMTAEYDIPTEGFIYNGNEIRPSVKVVSRNGAVMAEGTDYAVAYQNNVNVGTAAITVTPLNGMKLKKSSCTFNIMQKDAACFDIAEIAKEQYDGKEHCPEPAVKDRDLGKLLKKDVDYTLSYKDNVNEGNALVYITGIGNYKGQISRSFFISAAPIRDLTIKSIKDQLFKPGIGAVTPDITVLDGEKILTEGRDYSRSFSGNTHACTATVSVSGITKTVYDNSRAEAQFKILPYSLANASIEGIRDKLYEEGKDYSEGGHSVNVIVKSAATGEIIILKEGTDFEIEFDAETKIPEKAGSKVIYYIKGMGDYTGSVKKSFTVRGYIPMSDTDNFKIALSKSEYTYDGTKHRPDVKVTWNVDGDPSQAVVLDAGTDYTLSYSDNKNAGRAKVTVKPTKSFSKKNSVKGRAYAYYTIKPKTLEGCYMKKTKTLTYNSKARKPSVKVYTADGKALGTKQYYLEYKNNINAGTAQITAYGKKNHTGVLCVQTFEIRQQDLAKAKFSYRYDKTAGEFKYFRVCYGTSTLRENTDYKIEETGPDPKGKYTVTVTALPGRNFLENTTKSMKYKK
ncbi:MAG: hypothetical protein K6F86_07125 [Lachnospiraceae bacterium]|nr:hypothetical protein [Lachnospiraceae bacterium]